MPMSDFEYLPSVTVDQPAPTLLPSIHTLPFTPSLVCVPADDDPEIAPTLLHSIPSTPYAPSLASSATDSNPISTSTPPSSSPTSSTFLPSVTEEQPEPELESMPSITPSSTFAPTPPSSSTFLLSPVSMRSAMNSQPKIESALVSESAIPPSIDHIPEIASAPGPSLHPSDPPANLAPSPSTFVLLPIFSASSDLSSASPPPSLILGDLELEFSPTPSSAVEIVPLSSPELSKSESSLYDAFPILPASLKPSTTIPTSTTSQRSPRLTTSGSISSALEVTPAFALPTLVYEVSSTLAAPRFSHTPTPRLQSGFSFARLTLTLSFVTIVALVSLLDVFKTLSSRKSCSKNEDFGNGQIDTFKSSKSSNTFAHRLRLGQLTPCGTHFVFDPGGPASSSSFKLLSAHEDIRQRKSKTRNGLHHMHDTSLPTPVPINNPVFDPRGVAFDSATFDEDAR
ncbi:hypothetical protein EDB89DRAFT_2021944 [Lactarius sanguifluus]|nr:hypothetical protein EDB89DRAFT_2021944 [Lactarius sanguifluus]